MKNKFNVSLFYIELIYFYYKLLDQDPFNKTIK